eukprot:COSAG01_NODE_63908_length_278_cov_0.865922_1_plen_34_part_10
MVVSSNVKQLHWNGAQNTVVKRPHYTGRLVFGII